jgi:hypothetical protein
MFESHRQPDSVRSHHSKVRFPANPRNASSRQGRMRYSRDWMKDLSTLRSPVRAGPDFRRSDLIQRHRKKAA